MSFVWKREDSRHWDEDKARIVGGAPPGVFDAHFAQLSIGDLVPCEWWRVEENGRTVGYGWLDVVWGDAEILLTTDPAAEGRGVGKFIVESLSAEARTRGLNYLFNMVRPTHPRAETVTAWFTKRGFVAREDGGLYLAVKPS